MKQREILLFFLTHMWPLCRQVVLCLMDTLWHQIQSLLRYLLLCGWDVRWLVVHTELHVTVVHVLSVPGH